MTLPRMIPIVSRTVLHFVSADARTFTTFAAFDGQSCEGYVPRQPEQVSPNDLVLVVEQDDAKRPTDRYVLLNVRAVQPHEKQMRPDYVRAIVQVLTVVGRPSGQDDAIRHETPDTTSPSTELHQRDAVEELLGQEWVQSKQDPDIRGPRSPRLYPLPIT